MSNYNELELVKWLNDEKAKTDIEFGEFQTNRTTLETAGVLNEDDKEFYELNINRLRFRYRWLESQIKELNKHQMASYS